MDPPPPISPSEIPTKIDAMYAITSIDEAKIQPTQAGLCDKKYEEEKTWIVWKSNAKIKS